MSKVGTKHAAMASDPVQYLTNFGDADIFTEQGAALAEKYLVRGWAGARSSTTAVTFDDLRVENYTCANAGIDALPPTSSVIRGHIKRGAFLVHRACHLLATAKEPEERLAPLEHGWEDHSGTLLPSKCLKPQHRVCSQYASAQASVTLHDVAAVLLEFRASYSAMENRKILHVKTHHTNLHAHIYGAL